MTKKMKILFYVQISIKDVSVFRVKYQTSGVSTSATDALSSLGDMDRDNRRYDIS